MSKVKLPKDKVGQNTKYFLISYSEAAYFSNYLTHKNQISDE